MFPESKISHPTLITHAFNVKQKHIVQFHEKILQSKSRTISANIKVCCNCVSILLVRYATGQAISITGSRIGTRNTPDQNIKNDSSRLGFVTGDRKQTEPGSIPHSTSVQANGGGGRRVTGGSPSRWRARSGGAFGGDWARSTAWSAGNGEERGRGGKGDGWRAVVSGEMGERLSSSRISLVVRPRRLGCNRSLLSTHR